jgi:hypothetical protein
VGELYPKLNFGIVRVDWDRRVAALETHGNGGNVPIRLEIALDRLRRGP